VKALTWKGYPDQYPPVGLGMPVYDIGCSLTRTLRASGHAPPARVVTVTRIFPWGYRVTDGVDEWDCEHWMPALYHPIDAAGGE